MNKQKYWEAHVKRNPSFANEDKEIKITVRMLRRLMEEGFDKGYEHRVEIDKLAEKLFKGSVSNFQDIFKGFDKK